MLDFLVLPPSIATSAGFGGQPYPLGQSGLNPEATE